MLGLHESSREPFIVLNKTNSMGVVFWIRGYSKAHASTLLLSLGAALHSDLGSGI